MESVLLEDVFFNYIFMTLFQTSAVFQSQTVNRFSNPVKTNIFLQSKLSKKECAKKKTYALLSWNAFSLYLTRVRTSICLACLCAGATQIWLLVSWLWSQVQGDVSLCSSAPGLKPSSRKMDSCSREEHIFPGPHLWCCNERLSRNFSNVLGSWDERQPFGFQVVKDQT